MYSTQVFLYTQRQIVVLLSGTSPRSYMPQYSKPLTLHRGVDNQIQFQFLNQEQKKVDITGLEITCRIINADGTSVLFNKALTLTLPLTGLAVLNMNAADLEDIDAQKCSYSLEIPVNGLGLPVFVDQNAGARGDMFIVNSVLPSFVPSFSVSIPSGQPFPNISNTANANSPGQTYFSSVLLNNGNPVLTLQSTYDGYYGNVSIQGSVIESADWYVIDTYSYANAADTKGYTVKGFHPYIRVEYVSNCGGVTNILAR